MYLVINRGREIDGRQAIVERFKAWVSITLVRRYPNNVLFSYSGSRSCYLIYVCGYMELFHLFLVHGTTSFSLFTSYKYVLV